MKNFKGWKNVFSFHYKQNVCTKAYILVTVLVTVFIVAAAIVLSIIAAKPKILTVPPARSPTFVNTKKKISKKSYKFSHSYDFSIVMDIA